MLRGLFRSRIAGVAVRRGVRSWPPPPPKSTGEIPWAFVCVAGYAVGGLVSSTYWLLTLDRSVAESCYKCSTDAWGRDRQLEGLDELAGWIEWSSRNAGVDVCPKLVRKFDADKCIGVGLESEHAEVRGVAFEALAALTRNDALARRVAGTPAREALVRELERLSSSQSRDKRSANEWSDLYAGRLNVLLGLGNLTRDPTFWADEELLESMVSSIFALLEELRDAAAEAANAASQQYRGGRPPQSSRLGTWMAELQESVLRDMISELLAASLAVAQNLTQMPAAARLVAEDDRALDVLADLAWSEDPDCALHANFALHNTLSRLDHTDPRTIARLSALDAPDPEIGQPSGLDPRAALALNRGLDAFAPLPVAIAMLWGAARRIFRFHATGETFSRHGPSVLPRAAVGAAVATALTTSLLAALYGPRGARYEFRRGLNWSDDDASQITLATLVTAADLTFIFFALRAAPFCVTPFVLVTTFF